MRLGGPVPTGSCPEMEDGRGLPRQQRTSRAVSASGELDPQEKLKRIIEENPQRKEQANGEQAETRMGREGGS
jgi:hypothetical protein